MRPGNAVAQCYNRSIMKSAALFFLLLVVLLPMSAAPQANAPAAAAQQGADISVNVERKLVNFIVSDNKGKFITSLKKEDFKVFEDDRIQTITNFSSETNLPLTIALLVDSSGSITDKLHFEQDAASEFFYTTLNKRKDKAMVIDFDSQPELLQEFTDDADKLHDAVRKIRAGGGTAMFDAVYVAITNPQYGLAKQDGRKLIIIISDGDDNNSRISLTEALEAAQKNDVAIYCISTNKTADFSRADQQRGDKNLKRMADETGGRVFYPLKLETLTTSFQEIGQELRSQYTLAYSPTNNKADGTYRRIKVDVADKRYKARTPAGYIAPRAAAAAVK
jgi:Ca-activated chloride channel homolog